MSIEIEHAVRAATAADCDAVARLLAAESLPVEGLGNAPGLLVAEDARGVVAAAGLERYGDAALLRSVVVRPDARGRGLAQRLVAEQLARAAAGGAREVFLLTTTAAGYFARLGFDEVARADVPAAVQASAEFASLCPSSAAVLRRALDTGADGLRDEVRRHYADAARAVGRGCGCGGGACCTGREDEPFGAGLYAAEDRAALPVEAAAASLGCGNPTAVAELREGEIVLDLGSGGGIDVLLSARRVGPTGRAYGVDMTDEMLALARRNAAAAGATNVEFLQGEIEAIPLTDASVDVVISNCVVNLSTDKPAVIREVFRVLRPGGRVGISDIVAEDRLSPAERAARGSHVGCIAGALPRGEYVRLLRGAGFVDVELTFTHAVADGMHAAIVRARRPSAPRPSVLFLCVHNAGRSQMAAGFLRRLAGDRVEVLSGGSAPAATVNPGAVAAMAEVGIDVAGAEPRRWTPEVVAAADVVVTMGCGDACPVVPGTRYVDWELDDPAGRSLDAIRPIRDEIGRRVRALLAELGVEPRDDGGAAG